VIRTVQATRYVTPLREGGSLPAIVEADDGGLYVVKFRGDGQVRRALIAELIAGEIGRALGLPVPEIVLVELDPALSRNEPDSEIKALLDASGGLNLGLDFLPGAIAYDPAARPQLDPALASRIVWFDALVTNVDRTPRNTNLLLWHKQLYLIDHGAALYLHHAWRDWLPSARQPFAQIKQHVLLPLATELAAANADLPARLPPERLCTIVDDIPDAWLGDVAAFPDVHAHRAAYLEYLSARLLEPRAWADDVPYV